MTALRHSHIFLLLILLIVLIRLYPLIVNETCFADDCLRYYSYIKGLKTTPELLFLGLTVPLYYIGLDVFVIIKMFMVVLPLVFSFGLYLLLRNRIDNKLMYVAILFANLSLSFNLFWFVLLKNGLMIAFFPFFLHFYLEEKYGRSLFFLFLMALSHMTFILLAIPIIIHSLYKFKNPSFFIISIMLLGLFGLYYYSTQEYIIAKTGFTNLNYLFIEIPLLFFAIFSKKNIFKLLFLTNIVFGILSLLFMVEAWRIFVMLNVPILLSSMIFLNEKWNKIFKGITYSYLVVSFIFFITYVISLKSYM